MADNSIQTKRIISIEKGHEYQPKSNDKIGNAEVFFYDVYNQAKYLMDDIVSQMDNSASSANSSSEYGSRTLMAQYKEYADFLSINNVIAFCADRGNGKTSAMLSFSKIFCESESQLRENEFLSDTKYLRDHTYVVLSSIDPTNIEPDGSFLSTIITRMFFYFQQAERNRTIPRFYACSDQEFHSKEKERSDLLKQFQKCFSDVEILHNGDRKSDWTADGLERIAELSDSTNLRSALRDLVKMYLDYLVNPKAYLILSIDDADTNIELGYQILEDIRKYLTIPRVIILMATNMIQMETVVEQSYLERYKTGLSFSDKGSMITIARCHEAAELYLEKVIPGSRRIYLPSLESAFTSDFNPVTVDYGKGLLLDTDYQTQLLDFLHKKTGLVFLPANGYVHNFLPTNFRELSHFLSYFGSLSDCENPFFEEDAMDIRILILNGNRQAAEEKISDWRKRLDSLEHYLVYIWAGNNLQHSARTLFQDLTHQTWRNMSRFLLYNLPRYYCKDCEESRPYATSNYPYEDNFKKLCSRKGVDLFKPQIDSSYKKIIGLLDALTSCDGRERQYKLSYAIHLYYSISLHRFLLEDLRNIGKGIKPSMISKVGAFLSDISLFQVEDMDQNPFGHLAFSDFEVTPDRDEIKPFFRKPTIENNSIITYSINSGEILKTAIYDPSYFFLNQVDGIAQNTDDPSAGKDVNILSLVILLNWDVLRDIRHPLKTSWEKDKEESPISALRRCYDETVYNTCEKLDNGLLKGAKLTHVVKETIVGFIDDYKSNFLKCLLSPEEKDNIGKCLKQCDDAALKLSTIDIPLPDWNASTINDIVETRNKLETTIEQLAKYLPSSQSKDIPFAALRGKSVNNNNLKKDFANLTAKDFANLTAKDFADLIAKEFDQSKDIPFVALREKIVNNNNLKKDFANLTTKEFAQMLQSETKELAKLMGITLKNNSSSKPVSDSESGTEQESVSKARSKHKPSTSKDEESQIQEAAEEENKTKL